MNFLLVPRGAPITEREGAVMITMMRTVCTLLVATVSAGSATSCNFTKHLDFAGPGGALVRGPHNQQQCCDACVQYSAHLCIAAVWVPSTAECVVKWGSTHPMPTSKDVIACIRANIPPSPQPITPPPAPPSPRPRSYWPTERWRTSTPEAQGMDAVALAKATAFVRDFNPNGNKADAFLVVRGGFIVAESYWGSATADTIHDIASGTKSIGSMALAHAVHAGHFSVHSNISHFFPDLVPLTSEAAAQPLQIKHTISMAGGTNATYWQGRDGCGPPNASACPCLSGKTCPPTYPFSFPPGFVVGLRHGPPGAPESITRHGVLKRPGTDFTYSFANPAIMTGVLRKATNMSYAQYCATHLFPQVGVRPGTWYWLGDREGDSQPDGGSFHTARNYARMAYLMLNNGQWEVNGTVTQLLDPQWVADAARPPSADWSPCPFYSRFFWRKPLNSGKQIGAQVPQDAYYAFGGYGQFAVVVPSLDLVVVSLKAGIQSQFVPPADVEDYQGRQWFPGTNDTFMQVGDDGGGFGVKGGGWEFRHLETPSHHGNTGGMKGADEPNGDDCGGWPAGSDDKIDLLSGMMQLVVAAIKTPVPAPSPSPPSPPTGRLDEQTYLALDRRNIVSVRGGRTQLRLGNVTKHLNNPLLSETEEWEMRFDNMGPNVWHDPILGIWRAWYSSFTSCAVPPGLGHIPECCIANASDCTAAHTTEPHGDRTFALLYAESTDGVKFVKPSIGLVDFEGSTTNNLVGGLNGTTGTSVIIDRTGTSPYFKSFGCRKGESPPSLWLGVSNDGVSFNVTKQLSSGTNGKTPTSFSGPSLDGHMNVIFDDVTQKWIGFLRCAPSAQSWPEGREADRVQCYTESSGADYLTSTWSLPRPTGLNTSFGYQPDSHVAFRYANLWLAFTNTFNPSQNKSAALPPGQSNMILSWSADGRRWETIEPNESFIKFVPGSGQWDCCSVFGAKQDPESTPEFERGEATFPLFYAGCNGRFFGPRACGLGRVSVGRHAFAGLYNQHRTEATEVEIAPTLVSTGKLKVTVGGSGAVRVSVVGDSSMSFQRCTPIRNATEVEVVWASALGEVQDGGLHVYRGGAVGLVFLLDPGAVLWAFHV